MSYWVLPIVFLSFIVGVVVQTIIGKMDNKEDGYFEVSVDAEGNEKWSMIFNGDLYDLSKKNRLVIGIRFNKEN